MKDLHEKEARQKLAFIDFVVAAMLDAAVERKLTQLKTTIQVPGRSSPTLVRIIVVPETMDFESTQPLERTDKKSN